MVEHASDSELRAFQEVIGSLFEPGWLEDARNRDHPAVQRIEALRKASRHMMPAFHDWNEVRQLARAGLDATVLLKASGGSPKSLRSGGFANYGDDLVLKRLAADARNADQYQDVLVELTYAAWHLGLDHTVRAFQEEGLADFKAISALSSLPILADCKCVHGAGTLNNFDAIISKANKQIKAHDEPGVGVVVVDASQLVDRIAFLRPSEDRVPLTPPEVRRVRDACEQEMIDCNKSVSLAVVLWIDLSIQLLADEEAFQVRANRRGYCHPHPNARNPAPDSLLDLHYKGNGSYGFTIRPTSASAFDQMVAEFVRQDGVG